MGTPRVTSHDVARLAGVSRATVSLVLNHSEKVTFSPETRERVFHAAEELGYKPNSAARMLVSGISETIGLVISDPSILIHDAYIPQVLFGIETANSKMGFHVLVEGLNTDGQQGTYDNLVKSRRIDGLIVLNPRARDEALISLIERNFPIVLVGSVGHRKEVAVYAPPRKALEAAVDHLAGLGHSRVGTVTFAPRRFGATTVRIGALKTALMRHGLPLDEDAIADGEFSVESGYRATLELLRRRPDLTAIFAGNDTIAIGVLSAAAELGRRVPESLSVVGFDDLHFARWLTPALTTIKSDGVRQGTVAAELLFARLGYGELTQSRVKLEVSLVLRQSTGPAPR